jgi:ABC-2 type transport system ATP-binding protein
LVIEAINLTKRYGRTVAVDGLSFSVQPGRVTGFLGPNGAGKSTTMRLILGLDSPDAGNVTVKGKSYRSLREPLRVVGALLDARWVHPNRSARSHLRWLARSNRLSVARVDEVLGLVGLSGVASRRVGGFSLGMSQRLGIAAALLGDPSVLLFDEPVNGLDPEGILWIRKFVQGLAADGRTVLVSSHLLSEMSLMAEDLVVVGRGKLIAQCSTAEFIERAGESAVKVRSPHLDTLRLALLDKGFEPMVTDNELTVAGASTDQVGDIAAANGVVLHELSPQTGSLEQAFMRLTGDAVEYQSAAPALGK